MKTCVCMCIYMYICVYVCVCVYIYIYSIVCVTHTQRNIAQPQKKNEIMIFAAPWMDLEIILSKVSQTEKDKYHKILFMCVC